MSLVNLYLKLLEVLVLVFRNKNIFPSPVVKKAAPNSVQIVTEIGAAQHQLLSNIFNPSGLSMFK